MLSEADRVRMVETASVHRLEEGQLGLSPEFIKTRSRALIGITFRPKMPWSLLAPSADGSHIVAVAKEAGLGDNHLAFVQTAENLDLGGIQETNSHILAPDKAALAIAQYDLHYRLHLVGPARREGMSPNWMPLSVSIV